MDSIALVLIPLAVLIRVSCFKWNENNARGVAILIALFWFIWTIGLLAAQRSD